MNLANETDASGNRAKGLAVAVVFTAYMAVVFGLGLYLFSLLANEMRQSLGFGTQTIGAVTAAAQLSFLVSAFLCPFLTKRFGEGNVIVLAVCAAGILLAVMSTVASAVSMSIMIGALGACAAFMVIPTVGVISRTVPLQFRSSVNGLVSSGTAYGQLLAGTVAPILTLDGSWRSVWLVLGVVSFVIAIAGFVALKQLAPAAFARGSAKDKDVGETGSRLITGTNLKVWGLLAASGMACGPWQNYLSSFLGSHSNMSITVAGQVWSIIGFLGLFSGFATGMIADRIGIKQVLSLCYGLVGASAVLVAFHHDALMLYVAAVLFGLSFFAVYGLIPAYITKTMPAAQTTKVFAGANICLGLGTAFGNLSAGYIPDLTGSLQYVYVSVAGVAVMAALAVFLLPAERTNEASGHL